MVVNGVIVMSKKTNKFRSWITTFQYRHAKLSTLILMLLINVVIIFAFAIILSILSDQPLGIVFKWAIITSFSSDTVFDIKEIFGSDTIGIFIALIVLILIEMIMFTGAILGFTTNVLSEMFENRANARGRLTLTNHYVFLNWSDIGPDIIFDLSKNDCKYTIVILASQKKEEIRNSIDSIFFLNHKRNKNLRILIREGNPFSMKDLEDIAVSNAHSVAILSSEINNINEGDLTSSDLKALKLLLTVAQIAPKDCNIVVEAETKLAVDRIKRLCKITHVLMNKEISVFSFNCVLGLIMGNILINDTYASLYDELLSFDGKEFYSLPTEDLETFLKNHTHAIPIINYDDNGNGTLDQLYVMSDNYQMAKSSKYLRSTPYHTDRLINIIDENSKVKNTEEEQQYVYIVGASNKKYYIKNNIENYNNKNKKNVIVKLFNNYDIIEVARELAKENGNKKLLILSNELLGDDNRDANIYMSLLKLKEYADEFMDIKIYSEVLDPINYDSVNNFDIDGVVISNRLVSLLLVQLITHDNGANFYEDFISVDSEENQGAFDIEIVPAHDILTFDQNLEFTSKAELVYSFYESTNHQMMLLGISNEINNIYFLCDNMDKKENITINQDTQLVVVKY